MKKENTYLKTIALWKLGKGLLLLAFGFSLLFLDIREQWYVRVIEWIDEEIMLPRTTLLYCLLSKVETFLINTSLKTTAILSLVYATVLCVEGVGVYMEQRWAEWLMVIASASLLPLEIYHLAHKFTVFKVFVILINCFIVWYLYRTLKNGSHHQTIPS